jgi:hypothetical protein
MKILAWGAAVGAVAALVACGGGNSGNTGGGNTGGGNNTTTGSTMTTTVSSSSGSTNTTSTGGSGGGAPACGIYWEDPTDTARADCETCMEDNCCTEMGACGAGTDCDALLSCAKACADGDSTCVQTCLDGHQQGYTDYQTPQSCYSDSCQKTQACVYPICDSGLTYPDKDCSECVGTNCCDAAKACVGDQTCAACLVPMPADSCKTNTLYQAIDGCFSNPTCGPKCESSICGSKLAYPNFPSCNYCLSQQCCTSFDKCTADMNSTCYKCLTTSTATGCDADADFQAFKMCRDVTCKTDCGG